MCSLQPRVTCLPRIFRSICRSIWIENQRVNSPQPWHQVPCCRTALASGQGWIYAYFLGILSYCEIRLSVFLYRGPGNSRVWLSKCPTKDGGVSTSQLWSLITHVHISGLSRNLYCLGTPSVLLLVPSACLVGCGHLWPRVWGVSSGWGLLVGKRASRSGSSYPLRKHFLVCHAASGTWTHLPTFLIFFPLNMPGAKNIASGNMGCSISRNCAVNP